MKKPRLDRGPKLNSAIAQPQMMITRGVRQFAATGRELSAVTAMGFLDVSRRTAIGRSARLRGVNAFAWKSQGRRSKFFYCRAALQNRRVQFGESQGERVHISRRPCERRAHNHRAL